MFAKNRFTSVPKELRKATILLIIVGGFVTVIFDMFAFLLQFGKDAISEGKIWLGLFWIVLYFTRDVVNSSIQLITEELHNRKINQQNIHIEERTGKLLMKVRNKVFLSNGQMMSSSRIMSSIKNYIDGVWRFKFNLPDDVINVISTLAMLCGFVFVTNFEIEHSKLFFLILFLISIATIYFAHMRGKYRDRYRTNQKELYEERDAVRNDILNIEPQDDRHASFMINNYREAMRKSFEFNKKDWHDINKNNLSESIVNSLAVVFIFGIKIFEVGIENVNLETVVSIIALQTIYSNIIGKIRHVVRRVENSKELVKATQSYEADVKQIFEVYEQENNAEFSTETEFFVPEFEVEYTSGEKWYKLKNYNEFKLQTGECVLLTGPTGCGKSTFMKMLTGKIYFSKLLKTKLLSVMHFSDTRLGCYDILSEIVFGEDYDEEKLIHILEGLHLYEEVSLKNNDVIAYLKNTKAENYSDGQKQRFLIARMLYNLDDNVRIVAFDEATRALNDAIALQVIEFIKGYCKDKLLIMSSHQVSLCQPFANIHFEFVANGDGSYTLQKI